ncbi:helix-turn-helix transcriptional regulator [Conexibacter woesei]|uniref:helix-turn-helix transcriptional regulator n=1 Tax=Conexibacter woesei TaxID=191495 RepID=UPI000428E017|nr:LuxR family transcriptional regulator [Conexibacter woesei]
MASSTEVPTPELRGRDRERAQLDSLLTDLRGGASPVLVVRGEMGVGKTALLDDLAARATGIRVARATSVYSEAELPYAGLHQLCAPFLDRLDRLPGPQSAALRTVFGLGAGDAPDRFVVGLAILTLLSDVAEERPLLCIVDDAQWLDPSSAQALAFAARRVMAERVALVFGVREPSEDRELTALPELVLRGLGDADARTLLAAAIPGQMDGRVLDRLVAETRGNPLALLELPRGLTSDELAGGFGLPNAAADPLFGRVEESYARRIAALPDATRRLLLIAAAEPLGDPVVVLRAAEALGVGIAAASPAAEAGLADVGSSVRFSHPLVRHIVYQSAAPADRQEVHRALAAATDAETDPARRAWHRGQAVAGLDEDVALELEASAERAQARGGVAAGAAFLQRAAELTPDPARRAARALAAAQAKAVAGSAEAALRLVALAEVGPLDDLAAARAALVRARVTSTMTRGGEAPALLLDAALALRPHDAALSRDTFRDAFIAAISAGAQAHGVGPAEVAAALLEDNSDGAPADPEAGPEARLLRGLAVLVAEGYAPAVPLLVPALAELRVLPADDEGALRWIWLACAAARALADDASWDALSRRQVELTRGLGALALMPGAMTERLAYEWLRGDTRTADSLAAELEVIVEAIGVAPMLGQSTWAAAWRGADDAAARTIAVRRPEVERRGEGLWLITTDWMSAQLFNGLGRYDDALAAAARVPDHPNDLGLAAWVLPELVEAAVRSESADGPALAAAAAARMRALADAAQTDWALGLAARCEALLAEGDAADALYLESIERLGRSRIRSAAARSQLLHGEWLRRERRRADARTGLRAALELFEEAGAEGFAERARRELNATGETVRKRSPETLDDLTPQEAEIARLAASGQTNPEIGAQLFLSPRTVEWHLRKVFGKLGVTSRKELGGALSHS